MGRWSLTALMINSIVGSSVFGLPSIVAGKLGSSSPWAWVLAAIGTGFIVACVAEVASRFGGSGGPYLYARVAFGRLVGIESGWLLYLARITAAATNANLFIILLREFWPGASEPLTSRLILAVIIGGLAVLNFRGVWFGAAASNLFAVAKLVPLGLFIIAGLVFAFSSHGVAAAADSGSAINLAGGDPAAGLRLRGIRGRASAAGRGERASTRRAVRALHGARGSHPDLHSDAVRRRPRVT